MGKRYYAGVPGMHEQFGPVVNSAVKKGIEASTSRKSQPSLGSMITIMLIGLPILPIWSGFMMIGELFRMGSHDEEVKEQAGFNVLFAAFFFVIGCIMYSAIFNSINRW